MADYEEDFTSVRVGSKIYFDSFVSQGKASLKNCDTATASKAKNNGVAGPTSSGIPRM